jgi:hypothetical protein
VYDSECVQVSKAQLWRLLVVASVDPRLGPEKGADGGELVKVESRQLGGIDGVNAEALGGALKGNGDRNGTPLMIQTRSSVTSTVFVEGYRVRFSAASVQSLRPVQSAMVFDVAGG